MFTAEGNQVFCMAAFAAHSQESVLKATALEVILKLLLNIPRQIGFLRFKVLLERRVANAG